MKIRVFQTSEEAAHAVAGAVAAQLAQKRESVFGLPTGRTSLDVYEELARLHGAGEADFFRAHTFNIDEFVGLSSSDERSFCAFMQQHLFSHINLPANHVHFLDGGTGDHDAECARFERDLAALGGLDLLLLGIGGNAHIGFNEPSRSLQPRTHRTRLALETRRANAGLFGGVLNNVPREALTMGIGTMLDARAVCLIATGQSKARAVGSMFTGRISTYQPASFLQLHPNVEVILDLAAAEQLPESGFDAEP
ncbi:MAG TPA: glucosamine-6-phosphate deaminase [Vicinamibacterales bacterium]|nr:glucosamine-6-phosphate deaminase [Vicinamibacterales bacterium]